MENIRNFCIIAHIDHGKSTLADRMMEITETVEKREMKSQLLDSMDLERERGITIKLTPVTMKWRAKIIENPTKNSENLRKIPNEIPQNSNENSRENSENREKIFELNLIDTPGHVDFSYEVSRSLAAVEGAILVVDASQGIQAQTLQNLYLAMEQNLAIIPVLNKIDLPAADIPRVSREIVNLLNCDENEILRISAKTGLGVEKVLDEIVAKIPAPKSPEMEKYLRENPEKFDEIREKNGAVIPKRCEESQIAKNNSTQNLKKISQLPENQIREISQKIPLRALIFDSYYDDFRGVILYVRIVDGALSKGEKIFMMATRTRGIALEIGKLTPKMTEFREISAGEIGYIVTNLKSTREAKVGDTVSLAKYFAD